MSGYIGNIPTPQATQTRDEFTATAGQTSFATSGYTPNYLDVYLNGVHLDTSDYTATNGSDVVLASGAALNDELVVVAWSTFEAYNVSFTNLTDKPTTISGYGITDAFDGAFSSLTGTPTTLSGYGITDAATSTQGATADSALQDVVDDTTPQLGGNLDTNGNNISFGDSDKALFGAGNDLQLYHDGTNSYVQDAGTGDLRISGNNVNIMNGAATENYIVCTNNAGVDVKYDNATKLATTSSGVDVTGTVQGDSFTLDNGSNDWTFEVSSNKLIIKYGGTAKMELDTSGNLKVTGNVTAYGTI